MWLREKGLLLMLEQDYESAAELLEEAAGMFGADPDVVRLLTECYVQTGERDKALQASSELIRLQPDEIDGYLHRARLWLDQGNLNESLQDANLILERNPSNRLALSIAGRCYMKLGELDKARGMFKRIADEQPNDIEAVLALADIDMQKLDALKARPASGKQSERKKLLRALGSKPLGLRLKQGAYFLLSGKWVSLVILVILHLYAASSFAKYTGESLTYYFSHADKPLEIRTVASVDELGRLPAKVDGVRLALENAQYLGVVQVTTKEEDEEDEGDIRYLKEEEAQKQGPDSVITGYVFVGELNGKQLIVLANQKQAEQMGGRGKIELEGTVRDTDEDIVSEYQAWRSHMAEAEAAAAALPEKDEADKIKNSLERMKKVQMNLPFMYPKPETYVDAVKTAGKRRSCPHPRKVLYPVFHSGVVLHLRLCRNSKNMAVSALQLRLEGRNRLAADDGACRGFAALCRCDDGAVHRRALCRLSRSKPEQGVFQNNGYPQYVKIMEHRKCGRIKRSAGVVFGGRNEERVSGSGRDIVRAEG